MSQVAICLALLVGTGLLVRTLHELMTVDRGFDPGGRTVTFFPSMGSFRYGGQTELIRSFHAGLSARLRSHPQVLALGTTTQPPLTGAGSERTIAHRSGPEGEWRVARIEWRTVSDGFFEAIGTPIVRGREFTDADGPDSEPVVVVDQAFAARAWPGQNPIGRSILLDVGEDGVDAGDQNRLRVVGVAQTVPDESLSLGGSKGRFYLPFEQHPSLTAFYVVRAQSDVEPVLGSARAFVSEFDPDIALTRVQSLESLVVAATGRERLLLALMLTFAAVAVTLALVGVYGVAAFVVARRQTEFGLRLALGAQPGRVAASVFSEAVKPALGGLAIGAAVALLVGRMIHSVLFGVSAFDPLTYAATTGVLLVAICAACVLPALRTLSIDPVQALGAE